MNELNVNTKLFFFNNLSLRVGEELCEVVDALPPAHEHLPRHARPHAHGLILVRSVLQVLPVAAAVDPPAHGVLARFEAQHAALHHLVARDVSQVLAPAVGAGRAHDRLEPRAHLLVARPLVLHELEALVRERVAAAGHALGVLLRDGEQPLVPDITTPGACSGGTRSSGRTRAY